MKLFFRFALILAVAGLTPLASLSAADVSWTNSGTDGLFSNAANWSSSPNMPMPGDSLYVQNSGVANLDSYFTATELFLGRWATNNGTLNQTDGVLRLAGPIVIGDEAGAGELKMSGGLICTNSFLDLGRWNGSNGTLTMTGGNLYAYDWVAFGDSWQGPPTANGNGILTGTARLTTFSVLTIGGSEYGLGSLTLGTAGGADAPVVASATMNIANGGTGTLTLNTGSNVVTGATTIANGLTGTSGTLELNGGTYATSGITAGANGATPTITFNGGTIKATASGTLLSGSTLALKVQTASAKIDSNSFDVVASAPFINDGAGGLTKSGAGSLILAGAGNNYSGATVVQAGKLILDSTCTFTSATSNEIQVNSGASVGTVAAYAIAGYPVFNANITFNNRSILAIGAVEDSAGMVNTLMVNNVAVQNSGDTILVGFNNTPSGYFLDQAALNPPQVMLTYASRTGNVPNYLPTVDGGDQNDFTVADVFDGAGGAVQLTVTAVANTARGWVGTGGNTNWSNTSGWLETAVPNGTNARAWFAASSAPNGTTCVLDQDATVSSLLLKGGYTIASDSTHALTLQSSIAGNAQIQSLTGENIVNPNITIVGTPIITVTTGTTLTLGGNLSGSTSAAGISLTGGGTLALSGTANTFSGPIDVKGSTLSTAYMPAGNVSLNNSTLNYTNAAAYAATNGISASGSAVTVNTAGNITVPANMFFVAPGTSFTKAGAGSMNITFTGNDAYSLGSAVTYNKGTITVADARVMASGLLKFGDDSDVVLDLSGNAVFGSTSTTSQELAKNNGSFTLKLSNNATFITGSSILFGRNNAGGTLATNPEIYITISDNASLICGGEIRSGDANWSVCNYTMTGGSVIGKQVNFAYGYGATSKLDISGGMVSGTSIYFGNKRGAQIKAGEGLISGGLFISTGDNTIGYGGTDGYGTTNINLDLSGDAAFVAGGGIRMAYSSDNTNNRTGTIANVDMTGYSSMSAGSYIRIATGVAPKDTATLFDIGTLTMSGNSKITAGVELAVGNVAKGTGTLNMTGHTSATVTGAWVTTATPGELVWDPGELQVAWAGTGNVTLGGNATADDVRVSAATVMLGGSANAVATLELKAGSTLATTRIYSGAADTATDTVKFNGGILRATANDSSTAYFINNDGGAAFSLNVLAGGAIIDTNTYNITVDEQLIGSTGDGGLKKIGGGSLTLSVDPAYNGKTIVDEGTLNVTNLNTPAATVYVATGATLNASSIVADTLTIGGPQVATAAAVPEPGTLALLTLAVLGLAGMAWRKR